METWNREELYTEVWDQPPVKLSSLRGENGYRIVRKQSLRRLSAPVRKEWKYKQYRRAPHRY